MADVVDWLDARKPEPPEDLRRRIDQALSPSEEGSGSGAGSRHDLLLRAGQRRLDVAVAQPGRIRESAFELLAADALVTYACEAALEADDALEVLGRLVEVGRTR